MKKFLKSILIVLLLTIVGYSPVFYFNIIENPYGIFTSDFSHQKFEPNNHFIKMRYLLNNDTGFDSYIFGSSRANNVKPGNLKNGNYYNLYYSLGIPPEHLNDIRLLLSYRKKIKNILILLDYTSYTTGTQNRENDLSRIPYTDRFIPLAKKYIKYAFTIPEERFIEDFYFAQPVPYYTNMYKTGTAENEKEELYIENNREEHINHPKFNNPVEGYESYVLETIAVLDTINHICAENHINITYAFNPIHKTTYLVSNHELYFAFMKKLSELTSFYDFSGLGKITTNNYFYYEASHYRPMIGKAMTDFIQYGKRIDTIPEFGEYITKENVDKRIEFLKSQLPAK